MVSTPDLAVAFFAALATFFAPCAYALLPGYLGVSVADRNPAPGVVGLLARGIAAGTGMLVVLGTAIGLAFVVGQEVVAAMAVLEPVVGVVLVGIGLVIVTGRGRSVHVSLPRRPVGLLGYGVFGAGYAVAAIGCVLPVVIGVVVHASTSGGAVAVAYVAIVTGWMIVATLAIGTGGTWLSERSIPGRTLYRISGGLLVLGGLGQLWVAFG